MSNPSTPQQFAYTRLERPEILALKALQRGDASPEQQHLALTVIVNKLARAHDTLYIPNSFDATAFLNGRAYVGQTILKYLNIPIGKLDEMKYFESQNQTNPSD